MQAGQWRGLNLRPEGPARKCDADASLLGPSRWELPFRWGMHVPMGDHVAVREASSEDALRGGHDGEELGQIGYVGCYLIGPALGAG